MKRLLLALLLLIVLTAAALLIEPIRAGLVALYLPDYPDWPAPQTALTDSDQGVIYYSSSSPYDLEVIFSNSLKGRPTTGKGYLSYPSNIDANAPIPAMVIVPGSGGISPGREHEYASWFNQQGIAAFVVEYYEPRGFGRDDNYLIRTSSVTEFDLISDAFHALRLLGSSPLIDAERIGIIGFSYGGMAARLAMDGRIRDALAPGVPPFSLHIDTYGPCFQVLHSTDVGNAPLLTLRGTEDASNDLEACEARENELRELGTQVTAHVYQGAGHAWEVETPQFFSEDSPYLAGCELVYDQKGRPTLNGKLLNDYAIDASHPVKMMARLSSAPRLQECVGWGYLVGRDEKTRDAAYRDIQKFVQKHWRLSTERISGE